MSVLDIYHHFADGVYAKEIRIPAKCYMVKHIHDYAHVSILAQGSVVVGVGETRTQYDAPACVIIPKGQKHIVIAHTDSVWYCIHATEETDPAKVDQVLIKEIA